MANPTQYSMNIPTTNVWDTEREYVKELDVTKPEFKELLVRLFQDLNRMALSVNGRDAGIYDTSQFVNSQMFFPNPVPLSVAAQSSNFRQVYRSVINFGALPDSGIKTVAHHITCDLNTSFTRIYGVATDPVALEYIPLPYVDLGADGNIQLYVDDTDVNIVTTSDRTNYTVCYVVLEYLLY